MTMLSGCNSNNNKVEVRGLLLGKAPSSQEVVDKFNDFLTMFPQQDLTCLYDKEGDTSDLDEGDLGTWKISSFKYFTSENRWISTGVLIKFNRNTKQAEGKFNKTIYDINDINKIIEEKEFPVYYDKDGIHFVDENTEPDIKEELANFNMMFSFISLSREYLDSLEATRIMYNPEVPLYKATYKLTPDDKNIQQIKQLYPNLSIDENNITLELDGHGTPWSTTSSLTSKIFLDDKHNKWFSSSLSFIEGN